MGPVLACQAALLAGLAAPSEAWAGQLVLVKGKVEALTGLALVVLTAAGEDVTLALPSAATMVSVSRAPAQALRVGSAMRITSAPASAPAAPAVVPGPAPAPPGRARDKTSRRLQASIAGHSGTSPVPPAPASMPVLLLVPPALAEAQAALAGSQGATTGRQASVAEVVTGAEPVKGGQDQGRSVVLAGDGGTLRLPGLPDGLLALQPGSTTLLQPGAPVAIAAEKADGRLVAHVVAVGQGVAPPF